MPFLDEISSVAAERSFPISNNSPSWSAMYSTEEIITSWMSCRVMRNNAHFKFVMKQHHRVDRGRRGFDHEEKRAINALALEPAVKDMKHKIV